MKILLVADDPRDALAVERHLVAEGHAVATCHDAAGAPCRGVHHLDDCPLASPVDLAVVARAPLAPRSLGEMGAVCAARHRVGVVEIDPARLGDPRSAPDLYELADLAERDVCEQGERAVVGAIEPTLLGRPAVAIVRRSDRDLRVRVELAFDATPAEVALIADRARAGARDWNRAARVIDVSVNVSGVDRQN
jgi:hypothetical protein